MDIDKMEAGREMDALVVERVMGWMQTDNELFVSPPTGRVYVIKKFWKDVIKKFWKDVIKKFWKDETELRKEIDTIGKLLNTSEHFQLWQPSTDISAAWGVVEKIKDEFGEIEITVWGSGWGECTQVKIGDLPQAESDTAPLAICRAALKATEIE